MRFACVAVFAQTAWDRTFGRLIQVRQLLQTAERFQRLLLLLVALTRDAYPFELLRKGRLELSELFAANGVRILL
jgi:hypothetical protein